MSPVCSNEGAITFTPSLDTINDIAVSGPDYYCRKDDSNEIYDMIGLVVTPSFFFFQISKSGNLVLKISQENSDVDYIIWGPFDHADVRLREMSGDKIDYTIYRRATWEGDLPNCYTCSMSLDEVEYAVIPNAQEGDYYILMISNYGRTTNPISIIHDEGNTAETDCSIVELCGFNGGEITNAEYYASAESGTLMDISGTLRFFNAPEGGTLTITDRASGVSATYSAPFSSPLSFAITGIPFDGADERQLALSFSEGECDSTMTMAVTVPEELTLIMSHADNTECEIAEGSPCNGTATATVMGGVPPYELSWSTGESTASISGLCNGVYGFRVRDAAGTEIEDSVTVTTDGTITIDEGSVTLCPGDSYEFHGRTFSEAQLMTVSFERPDSCTLVYQKRLDYYDVADEIIEASFCEDSTYEFRGVTYSEPGTYEFNDTTEHGCPYVTYLILEEISLGVPSIEGGGGVCLGSTAELSVSGASEGCSFLWSGGEAEGRTSQAVRVSPAAAESYSVIVSKGGCQTELSTSVDIYPLPSIAVSSYDVAGETVIQASAEGGTPPYEFAADDNETSLDGLFEDLSKGYHEIAAIDFNGCRADTLVFVNAVITVPAFFTPNGDGVNDRWIIQGISRLPAHVYIYDRHGRLLLRSDDFEGWDGYYNGHVMPSDDYWYVIEEKETGLVRTGHFTLHRGK